MCRLFLFSNSYLRNTSYTVTNAGGECRLRACTRALLNVVIWAYGFENFFLHNCYASTFMSKKI